MSILTALPDALYLHQRPSLQNISTGFDLGTARALAWMAQLAYETDDPGKVRRILESWGWTLRDNHAGRVKSVLPLTSAKGFTAARKGVSILTFAGTEPISLADWILDFSIHMNANGIHDGFETGVDIVWDTISAMLGDGGPASSDQVVITGHSLGGALAAVAALRLVTTSIVDLNRIAGIYTFGAPRTGSDKFVENYRAVDGGRLADRTYRLIHGDDIVPKIPPRERPFAFRHVGCALACAHGALFDPANVGPDAVEQVPSGWSAVPDLLRHLFRAAPKRDLPSFPGNPRAATMIDNLPPSIRDHLMDRYLRALGAL
jgi:hypothetical protein